MLSERIVRSVGRSVQGDLVRHRSLGGADCRCAVAPRRSRAVELRSVKHRQGVGGCVGGRAGGRVGGRAGGCAGATLKLLVIIVDPFWNSTPRDGEDRALASLMRSTLSRITPLLRPADVNLGRVRRENERGHHDDIRRVLIVGGLLSALRRLAPDPRDAISHAISQRSAARRDPLRAAPR